MKSNAALSVAALPSAVLDRAAMTRAVEIAANVVEKRNTYPILANLRLTGDGNAMFVTATNLDMEIVVAVPAAADSGFDVTIPADLLKSLLKGAPKAEHIAFTMPPVMPPHRTNAGAQVGSSFDGEVTADFDKVRYDLVALHPEAFPTMKSPSHNEARRFTLSGAVLLDSLNAVSKAISNEETRYYLNGVCVQGHAEGLRFVATDGHRLMGQVVEAPEGAAGLPTAIWPKQFVYLLQKLMKGRNCPDTVSIMVDDNKIRATFGEITITSKLIEGTFPDVDRVTPKSHDKRVNASIKALKEAAAAVALIGKPGGVKFEFDNGNLTLSKLDATNGRSRMSIPIEQDFHHEFEIGFNARYVDELLDVAAAGGDDLVMAFTNSGTPTLFTSGKPGWYGVLMPMRV